MGEQLARRVGPLELEAPARLGGVPGDEMGAMSETATTATLLVAAIAVP